MFVLEVLVGVAVLAAVALLAAGRFDGLADEVPDDPDIGLPVDRPLRSIDVPRLRFRLAIRGYRMSDVDAAMAAVQEALRVHETEPAANPGPMPPPPAPDPAPMPPPPGPQPPFEPEPVRPTPPAPPTPEPLPEPEPPLVVTAEQPPSGAVEQPLSELERAVAGDADEQPSPSSWRPPAPPS